MSRNWSNFTPEHALGAVAQATQEINGNTAQVAAQQTIEISGRIDNAAAAINNHTAGAVAQGTIETVGQIHNSESRIISALFAKKEPWFIILTILSAIAIGVLLFWITSQDAFLTNVYDKDWNLTGKVRDVWSWFVIVLIPLAYAVFMVYVTGLGLKKDDRR